MHNKSEKINELALALSRFQGRAINPFKGKKGNNYMYSDLSDVLDVIREGLQEYELAVTQFPFSAAGTAGVETILMHSSGQWISNEISTEVKVPMSKGGAPLMSPAQAAGSVITYFRRYSLAAVLGLAQDDDDAAMQVTKQQQASRSNFEKPEKSQLERLKKIAPEDAHPDIIKWFERQTSFKSVEDFINQKEREAQT